MTIPIQLRTIEKTKKLIFKGKEIELFFGCIELKLCCQVDFWGLKLLKFHHKLTKFKLLNPQKYWKNQNK